MNTATRTHRKRTQRDYSLGFKLSVVDAVEKGEMTYKQAQEQYGIQGRSTVLAWLRKHGRLDWRYPRDLPVTQSKETPSQKIKRLERELEDERLRNLILEGMVEDMAKTTGGKFRKKPLSKESDSYKPKAK